MKIEEIKQKLDEKGIEYDANAKKAEVTSEEESSDSGDGIEVGEPQEIDVKKLPLVVKLPENASPAQVEYAKVLNGYAYQNRKKWEKKKDVLIAKLKSLSNKTVPVFVEDGEERPNRILQLNKRGQKGSHIQFNFVRDIDGKPVSPLPDKNEA